eukprot:EG_transcript_11155
MESSDRPKKVVKKIVKVVKVVKKPAGQAPAATPAPPAKEVAPSAAPEAETPSPSTAAAPSKAAEAKTTAANGVQPHKTKKRPAPAEVVPPAKAQKAAVDATAATTKPGKPSEGASAAGTAAKKVKKPTTSPTPVPAVPAATYKRRTPTVSIAFPSSILDTRKRPDVATVLAGAIARVATVFRVDEVVVFSEDGERCSPADVHVPAPVPEGAQSSSYFAAANKMPRSPNLLFFIRLLGVADCPQYLRKRLYPLHRDLSFTGWLPPMMGPHHQSKEETALYRQGVVLKKAEGEDPVAYCGMDHHTKIDQDLPEGTKITAKVEDGTLWSRPSTVAHVACKDEVVDSGTYWGFDVRPACGLSEALTQGPYSGGYDLIIGTSERGRVVDGPDALPLPPYKHLLIVFGGVHGLEHSIASDATIKGSDPAQLFTHWVNICPRQGSATIRAEEAMWVTMGILQRHFPYNK